MSVFFRYGRKMRASRLLSILILLQLRGRLTARALAEEFEVSERTIYRDVDALSAAGVPVYGDRGPGGGFQLLDGYRTQLTGLAGAETEAMLMIGLPGPASELGLGPAAAAARDKMLASLPRASGKDAGRIAERFHLDPVDWYRRADPVPHLPALARATLDQRRIRMRYESWTRTRDWSVEPLGLVLKSGDWYLVAQSGTKRSIFRISSITALDVTDETFEWPERFDLASWWTAETAAFEERLRPLRAGLRASPLGLKRLSQLGAFAADAVARSGAPDREGWRGVELPIESVEQAALMLLGIGAEFRIVSPPELKAAVRRIARDIAAA